MTKAKTRDNESRERLFYEIVETSPGSKAQGWHGILYGKDGKPKEISPGPIAFPKEKTGGFPFGKFVGVSAKPGMSWEPYGAIPEVLITQNSVENRVMRERWSYKIIIMLEGSRSVGTRGELQCEGKDVKPDKKKPTVTIPMGKFAWEENSEISGPHGWYPTRN